MDFLEPTEVERTTLEALRFTLIAAKTPTAIIDQLPGILADTNQNHQSMLTLVGALEPAAKAIGYALEGLRVFSARAPQAGRQMQPPMMPSIADYEQETGSSFTEATQDQRDAYQLDCAKFFIIAHTMASMNATDHVYFKGKKFDLDALTTPDGRNNGTYYACTIVANNLIPKIARLQCMTGPETLELLDNPMRPASIVKRFGISETPTRQ